MGGKCKNCPPFTNSRRHPKDDQVLKGKGKEQSVVSDEAASHCELDHELHVRQTGQIYKASHFSARNLCSAGNHLKNSNLCAGIGIIGPISDLQHTSEKREDARDEDEGLEEAQDLGDKMFRPLSDEEWLALMDSIDVATDFDEEYDSEEYDSEEYDSEDYDDEDEDSPWEGDDQGLTVKRLDDLGQNRRRVLKSQAKAAREAEEAKHKTYSETGVGGKTTAKLSEAKLQNENLFFFTDYEEFESTRYEYLAPKERKKGFVFGLFVPAPEYGGIDSDQSPAVFSSYANQESVVDNMTLMSAKHNFRELRNLGSRILDVRPFHNEDRTGYQVIYNEGDPCVVDPARPYQTNVKYQCDPEFKDTPNDFP